ncbi:argininosuccinate lyase [Rhodobacteraceae bacterium F11138]|nr:argininosuccinate lyase [Rhodobacteraceae bacterium F11138]
MAQSGCDANEQQQVDPQPVAVQPAVNVGIGVGAGGVNTYGGVGFYRGPLSVYLGF